jgi:hypothetical protein
MIFLYFSRISDGEVHLWKKMSGVHLQAY